MPEHDEEHPIRSKLAHHDARLDSIEGLIGNLASSIDSYIKESRVENAQRDSELHSYMQRAGRADWKTIFSGISIIAALFFAFLRPVETNGRRLRDHFETHVLSQHEHDITEAAQHGKSEALIERNTVDLVTNQELWIKALEDRGHIKSELDSIRETVTRIDEKGSVKWIPSVRVPSPIAPSE